MNSQFHKKAHINNTSYNKCKKTSISTFVDDCFSILEVKDKETLWNEIRKTIQIMNTYYTNNRLKNNVKKTKILIISNDEEIKKREETILNIKLKSTGQIKILGTIFQDSLKWNIQIREGKKLPNN